MTTLFLAMTLYPELQSKTQAEMRNVVDWERLPGFQDRENLPYIKSHFVGDLRWHRILAMDMIFRKDLRSWPTSGSYFASPE